MNDYVLVLMFFFGVTLNNLILISRLEHGRKKSIVDANKRLDNVADRAAEAARLLASYHVQLAQSTALVADRLKAADIKTADKLQAADIKTADKLEASDLKRAAPHEEL